MRTDPHTLEEMTEDFLISEVNGLFIPTTSYRLFHAWLNHQSDLTARGINFNTGEVLAIDAPAVYEEVFQRLLDNGKLTKLYYSYTMHGTDPFGKPQSQKVFGSFVVPGDTTAQVGPVPNSNQQ